MRTVSEPKRLTAAEKVSRDHKLVADVARGDTWGTVAARYAISTKQARNIWNERPQFSPDESDPLQEIILILEALSAAAEDFSDLARNTNNEAIRMGAIRHRIEMQLRRFDLMRQFGLIPTGQSEVEIFDVLETILGVLSQIETSPEHHQTLATAVARLDPTRSRWLRSAVPAALLDPPPENLGTRENATPKNGKRDRAGKSESPPDN